MQDVPSPAAEFVVKFREMAAGLRAETGYRQNTAEGMPISCALVSSLSKLIRSYNYLQ